MADTNRAAPAKSFFLHFLCLWKFRYQFCRLGKNHLPAAIATRGLCWPRDAGLAEPSSLHWRAFRKEGNCPFYPSHYLIWAQSLKSGWKDSWHTEEQHPDGSPLSFGWQGALSKNIPAAPVAQKDVKSNRQSWPFPVLILTPVPLMEQTLDYFQYKASGWTSPVQTLK